MDKELIGNGFYEVMNDLGEDYTITKYDGSEYTGKIALVVNSSNPYKFSGEATFPDIESQTSFLGCYFKRSSDYLKTYLLISSNPEQTNKLLGEVTAVKCNELVDLAYLTETTDENFNTVTVPEIMYSNVPAFVDSSLKQLQKNSDGSFDKTSFTMQIPAKYGISPDQVVLRKAYKFNEKTNKNELEQTRYRVESIDMSDSFVTENEEILGIMSVQFSLDTRG